MAKRGQRPPRIRTSIAAMLVDSDGGKLTVEVLDLSSRGFRLRAPEPLVVGEKGLLQVSRYGDFPVEILWVEDQEAGGHFLTPVVI